MRFSTLSTLALAGSAAALSLNLGGSSKSNQVPLTLDEDPFPIPGDNPLLYCADPKDYILQVDHVDLSPNPPEA